MTIVEHQHLVDTAWVESHLDDPDLRVFDCSLPRLPSMEHAVRSDSTPAVRPHGHIPGAGQLDLKTELSDPHSRWPLQFTMPTPKRFAEVMGRNGVAPDSHVVLYSAQHPMAAARVWWMLHAMGFDNASVMDGGWEKWVAEDRPVSDSPSQYPPALFETHPRPEAMAGRMEVRAAMRNPDVVLINALTRTQHAGGGTHYGRAGRIPGSRCVPAIELVSESDGCFRPRAELHKMFEAAGVRPGVRVITYCGVGIAAACLAYAIFTTGHENVAVYDGSLAEWSNDPTLPIEVG
jgi:thiosulfate/3-mercaptopyruvate sulfurtransferase